MTSIFDALALLPGARAEFRIFCVSFRTKKRSKEKKKKKKERKNNTKKEKRSTVYFRVRLRSLVVAVGFFLRGED